MKVTLLKRLGDFALFIAGYFPSSLNRQLVDTRYYAQMGGSAYTDLAQLVSKKNGLNETFEELAGRFLAYVDILSEVSEECHLQGSQDLLRLYETWLKTGSPHALNRLHQKGILPTAQTIRTQ